MRKYLIAGTIAFLAGAIVGCSNSPTAPERVKFQSSISAKLCSNGKFSVTTNWNAPVTWRAIFNGTSGSETTSFSTAPKTSSCIFKLNDRVYAILDNNAVASDNDATDTIVVK